MHNERLHEVIVHKKVYRTVLKTDAYKITKQKIKATKPDATVLQND